MRYCHYQLITRKTTMAFLRSVIVVYCLTYLMCSRCDAKDLQGFDKPGIFQPNAMNTVPLIPLGVINSRHYFGLNLRSNWVDALGHCHQRNMTLARVATSEEIAYIGGILSRNLHADWVEPYAWTSGTDLGSEGLFRSFNTNEIIDSSMIRTAGDNRLENCVQISRRSYLFDYFCEDVKAITVCEL